MVVVVVVVVVVAATVSWRRRLPHPHPHHPLLPSLLPLLRENAREPRPWVQRPLPATLPHRQFLPRRCAPYARSTAGSMPPHPPPPPPPLPRPTPTPPPTPPTPPTKNAKVVVVVVAAASEATEKEATGATEATEKEATEATEKEARLKASHRLLSGPQKSRLSPTTCLRGSFLPIRVRKCGTYCCPHPSSVAATSATANSRAALVRR